MNGTEEIRNRSERNLKAWREEIGIEACALVPTLIAQHAPCKSFVAYHTTDLGNFDAIQKSGFIYSYEKLQEMNLEHKEGWTIGENKIDDAFKNAVHEADAHQDHVYMRPLLGPYAGYEGKTGFLFRYGSNAPPITFWISFYDNNFIHLSEISCILLPGTLHKGFSTDDVFTGDALPEAVTLKALKYILDASRRAEIGKQRTPPRILQPRAHSPKSLPLIHMADGTCIFSVLQYLNKAEQARLKWPKKIDEKILQDPEGSRLCSGPHWTWFMKTLADNGQVAFPGKVSVSNAVLVRGDILKRLPAVDQSHACPAGTEIIFSERILSFLRLRHFRNK